jgi:hypothetical protein
MRRSIRSPLRHARICSRELARRRLQLAYLAPRQDETFASAISRYLRVPIQDRKETLLPWGKLDAAIPAVAEMAPIGADAALTVKTLQCLGCAVVFIALARCMAQGQRHNVLTLVVVEGFAIRRGKAQLFSPVDRFTRR